MKFLDLAKKRYTTKKYDPTKKISSEIIEEIKEILRLSPSSINSQPWKFTIVGDQNIKRQLAEHSQHNTQKITDASHIIVFSVIDSIALFEKQIEENIPETSVGYYNEFVKIKEEEDIKAWLAHQVYISLGYFLTACASLGLDSTPMEGINNDEYDKILGLENYHSLFAVAIGYRDLNDTNHPSVKPKTRLSIDEIIEVK
ncbi:NAD(P)H-dependent oxidoreductase [Myroides injenensis]|uniref:NAD(P)H-dependent oxidoreductase n=1 Tax=Myroides injenensis TaxID=1183151 RepID=UPI002271237C|nr:NAD(P)H-dependent oxidoreductase [Myroides injenensis]